MTTPSRVGEVLGAVVDREGGAPEGWRERLSAFLDLLIERNQRVNLVSRPTVAQALEKHVLPSLAALLVVPPRTPLRIVDVGSGGGFPGIPLAILRPDARVDLVEATRKKCDFLTECVAALGIANGCVHWCRIESPREELVDRSPFDVALARAVGAPEKLAKACRSLLVPEGRGWSFAGPGEGPGLEWHDGEGRVITVLRELGGARPPVAGEVENGPRTPGT